MPWTVHYAIKSIILIGSFEPNVNIPVRIKFACDQRILIRNQARGRNGGENRKKRLIFVVAADNVRKIQMNGIF